MNLNDYDDVEVRYCVELIGAGGNHYAESFGDEAEAGSDEQFTDGVCTRFWSVYLHYDPAGSKTGVECIADCPAKEYAELIAESVCRACTRQRGIDRTALMRGSAHNRPGESSTALPF